VAGIVAATHRNSSLDIAALLGSLVGISLPIFWLGLLDHPRLLGQAPLAALRWHGHPRASAPARPRAGSGLVGGDRAHTRASDAGGAAPGLPCGPARAKGVSGPPRRVSHALGNAMIPILTVLRDSSSATTWAARAHGDGLLAARSGRLIVEGILRARLSPWCRGALLVVATTFRCSSTFSPMSPMAFFDPRILATTELLARRAAGAHPDSGATPSGDPQEPRRHERASSSRLGRGRGDHGAGSRALTSRLRGRLVERLQAPDAGHWLGHRRARAGRAVTRPLRRADLAADPDRRRRARPPARDGAGRGRRLRRALARHADHARRRPS